MPNRSERFIADIEISDKPTPFIYTSNLKWTTVNLNQKAQLPLSFHILIPWTSMCNISNQSQVLNSMNAGFDLYLAVFQM